MDENAIHFTPNPLNAYVPVIGGTVLLGMALMAYIFMPHATTQIIACVMFGMMAIAVGISQFGKLSTPRISLYPQYVFSGNKRIDFCDILKIDRQGKLELKEKTHQLPLQLLSGRDRFQFLKLLNERLKT